MASRFNLSQYAAALMSLLPRGRVWQRNIDSVQASLIEGLARTYQQVDAAAVQLLVDAFPATTTALIDEWNATVGIPDPCFGAPETIEQNRQFIVTKLTADGGQSVNYYTALAANLGLTIVIREFSPLSPGASPPVGLIINLDDWAYTWQVKLDIDSPALLPFAGDVEAIKQSQAYKALACLLARYKPAHTQFYISVVDPDTPDDSVFGFDLDNEFISGFDAGVWSAI